MAPGLGPKNSATGTEKIFRALIWERERNQILDKYCIKYYTVQRVGRDKIASFKICKGPKDLRQDPPLRLF